jgi:hypothetical protein
MAKFDLGANGGEIPQKSDPENEETDKICHLGAVPKCVMGRCPIWNPDEGECQDVIERDERIHLLNRTNAAIDTHGDGVMMLLAQQFAPEQRIVEKIREN